jgi:hypothetical protein
MVSRASPAAVTGSGRKGLPAPAFLTRVCRSPAFAATASTERLQRRLKRRRIGGGHLKFVFDEKAEGEWLVDPAEYHLWVGPGTGGT